MPTTATTPLAGYASRLLRRSVDYGTLAQLRAAQSIVPIAALTVLCNVAARVSADLLAGLDKINRS